MTSCAFRLFLDVECPGCGLGHSIVALLQGHWEESLLYHPMGVVVTAWVVNFWWLRRFEFSPIGSKLISHAVLFGFFAPWMLKIVLSSKF